MKYTYTTSILDIDQIDKASWSITSALCERDGAEFVLEKVIAKNSFDIFTTKSIKKQKFIEVTNSKNGDIIGRCIFNFSRNTENYNWLSSLYVNPLYRGQSISIYLIMLCLYKFGEFAFVTSNDSLLAILKRRLNSSHTIFGTQADFCKLDRTTYQVKIYKDNHYDFQLELDYVENNIGELSMTQFMKILTDDVECFKFYLCKKFSLPIYKKSMKYQSFGEQLYERSKAIKLLTKYGRLYKILMKEMEKDI
jgi:hypothetical protein